MNAPAVGDLLGAMRRAAAIYRLYGPRHPLTHGAAAEAAKAADALPQTDGPAVITVLTEGVYLDRYLLPTLSLDYDGFLEDVRGAGIESLTFVPPVEPGEVTALAEALAQALRGRPDHLPEGTTILVNQAPWSREQLIQTPMSPLREAYASSLQALRLVGLAAGQGGEIPLPAAAAAVQALLDQTLSQPATALLLSTLKGHHEYTLYHSANTCILTLHLGRTAGCDQGELLLLGMAALLHDIGKLALPLSLLDAPGRLTPQQMECMRRHPQAGAQMVMNASQRGQETVASIVLEHHMGYDRSGYPSPAFNGHPLHPFTGLVTVADIYDAVTSRRSYRRAETPARALQILMDGVGTTHHPDIVDAFIDVMGLYPPGSLLRLKGGEIAMVTRVADQGPAEAVLVVDADGNRLAPPAQFEFDAAGVAAQLTPEAAGIEPAEVLESMESAGQMTAPPAET